MIVKCENCGREHIVNCDLLDWRCSFIHDDYEKGDEYELKATWEGWCECNEDDPMEVTFYSYQTREKKLIPMLEETEYKRCIPEDSADGCVCDSLYDPDEEFPYWK